MLLHAEPNLTTSVRNRRPLKPRDSDNQEGEGLRSPSPSEALSAGGHSGGTGSSSSGHQTIGFVSSSGTGTGTGTGTGSNSHGHSSGHGSHGHANVSPSLPTPTSLASRSPRRDTLGRSPLKGPREPRMGGLQLEPRGQEEETGRKLARLSSGYGGDGSVGSVTQTSASHYSQT